MPSQMTPPVNPYQVNNYAPVSSANQSSAKGTYQSLSVDVSHIKSQEQAKSECILQI